MNTQYYMIEYEFTEWWGAGFSVHMVEDTLQ